MLNRLRFKHCTQHLNNNILQVVMYLFFVLKSNKNQMQQNNHLFLKQENTLLCFNSLFEFHDSLSSILMTIGSQMKLFYYKPIFCCFCNLHLLYIVIDYHIDRLRSDLGPTVDWASGGRGEGEGFSSLKMIYKNNFHKNAVFCNCIKLSKKVYFI